MEISILLAEQILAMFLTMAVGFGVVRDIMFVFLIIIKKQRNIFYWIPIICQNVQLPLLVIGLK